MPRTNKSSISLLRVVPFLFPVIFIWAAASLQIDVLYGAVLLHFLIIAAELTIGRRFADTPIPTFIGGSTTFEDACLIAWAALHLLVLSTTLYFVGTSTLTYRQVFAVGALFGYSINTFSAAAAHELLHRSSPAQRFAAQLLYAVMLYPHFPTVHLVSHHHYAGTSRDCQTPKPQQSVHAYLIQALVGGIRIAASPQARTLDGQLQFRVTLSLMLLAASLGLKMPAVPLFLITQGLFSFLLVETINYIQHFRLPQPDGNRTSGDPDHANQDLNFISRCLLFNLPLHAAHHDQPGLRYSELSAIPEGASSILGYWCSFWLAWLPPLWHNQHFNHRENRG